MSIVEAMACGVPVVVSPGVNLAPDIEDSGAGWIAACDVGAIQGALRSAMSDPRARMRRGAAARELAGRFRWSTVVPQLAARYREVVDGSPRLAVAASRAPI